MRCLALLVLVLAACPKQEREAQLEPMGSNVPPPSGRSVTKLDDAEGDGDGGLRGRLQTMAGGSATGAAAPRDAGAGSKAPADAQQWGGNGTPAYRDENGLVRGPGGPVFMGRGPECNAERDHCLRDGVWFAAGNLVAGKLYRATPVFEFEGKWYNWRGKLEDFTIRFKTKVATRQELKPGDPVIWFIDENANRKFADNEYDALTSSRWEAGVIDSVATDTILVKGWTYGAVPIDTARVVVERQ